MIVHLLARDVGAGRPVVLLHAFPLNSAMWSEQRDDLAVGYRVITPDQRGWNGSALGDDAPSLDRAADDLVALLDDKGLDRVVLGGLSMGGYVAMAFLRRYAERVSALILANTRASADSPEGVANRMRIADAVEREDAPTVLLDEVVPGLVGETTRESRPLAYARVRSLAQSAPPAAIAWTQRAMAARPDSLDLLRTVGVPTLVIGSDEDTVTPYADAQAMAEVVPGAGLVRLSQCGHLSAVERPREFNDVVREFLNSLR